LIIVVEALEAAWRKMSLLAADLAEDSLLKRLAPTTVASSKTTTASTAAAITTTTSTSSSRRIVAAALPLDRGIHRGLIAPITQLEKRPPRGLYKGLDLQQISSMYPN
jgi:hypothetical protein